MAASDFGVLRARHVDVVPVVLERLARPLIPHHLEATVDDLLDFCLTENRMDKKIVKKPIPGRAILDIAQQHSTRNIGPLTEVKLENI